MKTNDDYILMSLGRDDAGRHDDWVYAPDKSRTSGYAWQTSNNAGNVRRALVFSTLAEARFVLADVKENDEDEYHYLPIPRSDVLSSDLLYLRKYKQGDYDE